jgi:septum formation protein
MKPAVVLGSGSPRRLALLRSIGVEPRIVVPDVDESVHDGESPENYVRRLASSKLDAVLRHLDGSSVGTVVIAADTTVEVADDTGLRHILAKPVDVREAHEMLAMLSGREHRVHTGFAVAVATPGCRGVEWTGHVEVVTTTVEFREMSPAEIDEYVATGEPLDKAGAYAIQGGGARFVERIEGPLDAVIGLPLDRIIDVCAGLGQSIGRS